MRVIERSDRREDEHFTEGEPDLEPPEELAVLEVDEETLLETDLDLRADLEDEVDVDVLESILDHLIHDADDDGDDGDGDTGGGAVVGTVVALVDADLEIDELEDREESLDRILQEKLAGDEEHGDDRHELAIDTVVTAGEVRVSACGALEFVCSSCFLVRGHTQRAASSGSLCRDCGE